MLRKRNGGSERACNLPKVTQLVTPSCLSLVLQSFTTLWLIRTPVKSRYAKLGVSGKKVRWRQGLRARNIKHHHRAVDTFLGRLQLQLSCEEGDPGCDTWCSVPDHPLREGVVSDSNGLSRAPWLRVSPGTFLEALTEQSLQQAQGQTASPKGRSDRRQRGCF